MIVTILLMKKISKTFFKTASDIYFPDFSDSKIDHIFALEASYFYLDPYKRITMLALTFLGGIVRYDQGWPAWNR